MLRFYRRWVSVAVRHAWGVVEIAAGVLGCLIGLIAQFGLTALLADFIEAELPPPSLQGAVTNTADGRFHFITTRTDAPKYASSDPVRPTPDEAMAVASGSIAYTGTYTVDENTKTIHANIETSTFPNLVGAPNQRRIITSITADEMKFTNPRTPAGVTLEFVWKRAT